MFKILFKHIDNSQLVVFRVFFGALCFLESFGAILTGWVKQNLVTPKFTFSFIGFEWLQPLDGNGMYIYYLVMSVFGLGIMLGYKYRFSAIGFTLMWTAVYLMQKSAYNNHYYLLVLLSAIMVFLPAHKAFSLDAKRHPEIRSTAMPNWCRLVFIVQLFIVYTYASVAKLYPDWLDGTAIEILMKGKQNYPVVGAVLQQKWLQLLLSYGGILFDGLIVPLLLFKPTRKMAFIISVGFHLFNSIVFQIGIFPYLALALYVFFFPPQTIQKLVFKKRVFYNKEEVRQPKYVSFWVPLFLVYFVVQTLLPLRHHCITDDVLWTEEGHRLSWRMMLRVKRGYATYKVKDKTTGKQQTIDLNAYLTPKQQRGAKSKPDIIWQFAQHLKQDFKAKGQDVAVYVSCRVGINGKPIKRLIDPKVDLASVSWHPLQHSEWILPSVRE